MTVQPTPSRTAFPPHRMAACLILSALAMELLMGWPQP
jgi:hypothetical protein